ncbi:MAG: hypothetical protein DMD59_13225 [Gemmatimonadetes bacterium]|nr:MAG: hypothetical protein DMD59_13225 [Gemmatimonadota bacterium]
MRQSLVSAALLAFVIPLSACLSYTPLGNVTPARGAEVVATVTPIDVRVGEITVHHVTRVEGRVAFADADSVMIAGSRFVSETGTEYRSVGDVATIPRTQVLEIKQKRVSAWKTAIAFGASGAAVAAIIAGVGPLAGFGSGGGPPKPPP